MSHATTLDWHASRRWGLPRDRYSCASDSGRLWFDRWFDQRLLVLNFPNSLVGFASRQQFLVLAGVHHLALVYN
jgi:hypothetical protein